MTAVKQFFNALLDVITPPICHICQTYIPNAGSLHICTVCSEQLKLITSPLCTVCGIPFIGIGNDHRCGRCISTPPFYDITKAPFIYEGGVRKLIHHFKYDRRTHLSKPLTLLLLKEAGDSLRELKPDMIVPVPLHKSRLRERGFNQAVLLGNKLSEHLKIPLKMASLKRVRQTEPQIDLSAAERQTNVRGAFAIQDLTAFAGKRVLLLDDVMTTGSTINECAKVLKSAGASIVIAATVARAPI